MTATETVGARAGELVAATVEVNEGVSADVDAAVAADPGLRLMGWSARESAGTPAAAAFTIKNGATGNGGTAIVPVNLSASESAGDWYRPAGVDAATGLSLDVTAGTVDVYLYYVIQPS